MTWQPSGRFPGHGSIEMSALADNDVTHRCGRSGGCIHLEDVLAETEQQFGFEPICRSLLEGENSRVKQEVLDEISRSDEFRRYVMIRNQLDDAQHRQKRHEAHIAELDARRRRMVIDPKPGLAEALQAVDAERAKARQDLDTAIREIEVLEPVVPEHLANCQRLVAEASQRTTKAAIQRLRDTETQAFEEFFKIAGESLTRLVGAHMAVSYARREMGGCPSKWVNEAAQAFGPARIETWAKGLDLDQLQPVEPSASATELTEATGAVPPPEVPATPAESAAAEAAAATEPAAESPPAVQPVAVEAAVEAPVAAAPAKKVRPYAPRSGQG